MRKLIAATVVTFFALEIIISSGIAQTGSANLNVTASGTLDPNSVGTFSGTVVNKGPDQATNVVVTGGIPGGTVQWVTSSQGSCTISGDSFTCSVGTLPVNAAVSLSMGGPIPSVPPGQTYCGAHYTASASETDPVPSNNTASA